MKSKKQVVLVRTYSAGIHFGTLVSRKGKEVTLSGARRIWQWFGANTLHEIATFGLDVSKSNVSVAVEEIVLTEAIEVIPMAKAAVENLMGAKWNRK